MLIETAMSLAAPWPLKVVLDSVFASRPLPAFLVWLLGTSSPDPFTFLFAIVGATVTIALLQAAGAYINEYYAAGIGQRIAHDLRQSVYGSPCPTTTGSKSGR